MIISVVNNKGGVGKTCCASNLAHALSLRGVKVLLVDNDPQSNSTSLMLGAGANPESSLYHVYRDSIPITQAIYTTPYGADVVPNSNRTDTLELELYQKPAVSYFMLRNALREHALKNYDLTLIDCPPTLGLWVVQALITSDACIVPIESGSTFSLDGLASVYSAIEGVAAKANHDLKFLKALINKVDMRVGTSKRMVEMMHTRYPGQVFDTTIPANDDIKKAEGHRKTIISFAPQSSGAKRFRLLAEEVDNLLGLSKKTQGVKS